ncbi:MAG: antibiotic biosynthesis monooxygenase [Candidatus Thiodiazotropha sp. (ex Epidulcina cf. delphinae)]|nr:antibiotic biosynthesis monooxygenase [Candidatus Thiodiazotropha sp. (ex Epidulcina cf. delphinae)]
MLSFMLSIKVKEDCEQRALESLAEIDRKANTHQGVRTFMWFQHIDEPLRFTLIEQWQDQDALDRHIAKVIDVWNTFEPCLDQEPVSTKLYKLIQDN